MPCPGVKEMVYMSIPGKVSEIPISDPEGASARRNSPRKITGICILWAWGSLLLFVSYLGKGVFWWGFWCCVVWVVLHNST